MYRRNLSACPFDWRSLSSYKKGYSPARTAYIHSNRCTRNMDVCRSQRLRFRRLVISDFVWRSYAWRNLHGNGLHNDADHPERSDCIRSRLWNYNCSHPRMGRLPRRCFVFDSPYEYSNTSHRKAYRAETLRLC